MSKPVRLQGGGRRFSPSPTDDDFAGALQLVLPSRSSSRCRGAMTSELHQTDLGQQTQMLEAACRHLLLRPHDARARERLTRTIAATTLPTEADASASLRGLVGEVRTRADSLAFRLESAGYNGLYISAATAMLCQALAQLRVQLMAPDARAMAMRLPREIDSPV
jgi:hypothetical protein